MPTRLLDWTFSPWIAAFFACQESMDKPGRILLLDKYVLEDARKRFACESNAINETQGRHCVFDSQWTQSARECVLTSHVVGSRFLRLNLQQGFFTVASKPWLDHWIVASKMLGSDEHYRTIGIISEAKPNILQGLERMSMTAASLFPGVDGIGMSLRAFAAFSHLDKGVGRILGCNA